MLRVPAYPAALKIAETVAVYFARRLADARARGKMELAAAPDAATVEAVINTAFWASLRREEGYAPKISLAFLPPEQAGPPLKFARPLPLDAGALAKLAPAVERPGIHLGVWHCGDGGELCVWGTTRTIPRLCFVLEVIEPGLLVVKYRRGRDPGKYANVAVLRGDEVKVVDEAGASLPDCPEVLNSLIGFGPSGLTPSDSVNVLVQLAVSMRSHGRGGTLLVVPADADTWRESVRWPAPYSVEPAFPELRELMARAAAEGDDPEWQEALRRAVEAVAGLTAVDGAAVVNERSELLAFGAKITRRHGAPRVERVTLTEPVVGTAAAVVEPAQLGGTRHLSAAQFVQDQQDALALVASQDGRFTVFSWSPCEAMVHAHRVETLLL
ncbi:MAG TPA: hypothetical protein VF588_21745 [Pyrinomonadaceae bacterium]|jgi:hypothetical protein